MRSRTADKIWSRASEKLPRADGRLPRTDERLRLDESPKRLMIRRSEELVKGW